MLHSFAGGGDGAFPYAGLISDASGALYGTTAYGSGAPGYGTVFKLTPSATPGGAWTESVLHSFAGGGDGAYPFAGLISDASGALYGTTLYGSGAPGYGYGTVFKLTPPATAGGAWTESVLHSFAGGGDGAYPYAGLISDASGALYGTASQGGGAGWGTVFELTVSASFVGVPGQANCRGQSISFLARRYGGIAHAAASLGFASVTDLQNAVAAYCGG